MMQSTMSKANDVPTVLRDERYQILAYLAGILILHALNARPSTAAAAGNAVLILLLFNHSLLSRSPAIRRALLTLSVLPMFQLLSISLPLNGLLPISRTAIIAVPLLLAEVIIANQAGFWWSSQSSSLRRTMNSTKSWKVQGLIAACGLPLGLVGYLLVHPQPLVLPGGWAGILAAGLALALGVAVLEEVFFRGLLLQATEPLFGRYSVLLTAGTAALLQMGAGQISLAVFTAISGLFLAESVRRTGTLTGAVLAQVLITTGLYLFWPMIF